MLKQYSFNSLTASDIEQLIARNTDATHAIQDAVSQIIEDVRHRGDQSLRELTLKFDKVDLETL